MALDAGLIAWVVEAVKPLGAVTHRPMMGGATFYCDGTVFAIVAADALWFKADKVSDAAWDEAGCERFTYPRERGTGTMNYRRAPDDGDAMREWARLALEAGLRAPKKRSKTRSS